MKKLLFLSASLACCFFISCNNKDDDKGGSKKSSAADKNIETVHAISKAIESGDVSKLGDYITADAVDHGNPMGDVKGLDSIKAELSKIHMMADDMKMEVKKTLADDDHVFEWVRYTGTTKTADMGMPAGTKYDMTAIHISKFSGDKVSEHWEYLAARDMMKMMGGAGSQMPTMNDKMEHKMDTMKK